MAFPKPTKADRLKAKRAAVRAVAVQRTACRTIVWQRDGACCRRCKALVYRSHALADFVGHVHEVVFRSKQGDPTDPTNCLLLCPKCHVAIHAHRLTATILEPAKGTDGEVEFIEGGSRWA